MAAHVTCPCNIKGHQNICIYSKISRVQVEKNPLVYNIHNIKSLI